MSGPTIKDYAAAIERVAFSIPAPNEFTPVLIMLANELRSRDFEQIRLANSAAPDMAEALEALLSDIDQYANLDPRVRTEAFHRARSALATARGET